MSLTVTAAVTFYSYYLMSKVLDRCEKEGRRHIRFRELAADVLGTTAFLFFFFLSLSYPNRLTFHSFATIYK